MEATGGCDGPGDRPAGVWVVRGEGGGAGEGGGGGGSGEGELARMNPGNTNGIRGGPDESGHYEPREGVGHV